jgi:hypothetical protein
MKYRLKKWLTASLLSTHLGRKDRQNVTGNITRVLTAVLCLGVVLPAEAALMTRLGGAAAYDDVLDITWTTDANINGMDTWANQVAWADGFTLGGFGDWRLASMSVSTAVGSFNTSVVGCNTASEMDCRDNELGYMFYQNMGGNFFDNKIGTQTVDGVDLTNVGSVYWSGTEPHSSFAWRFIFSLGFQGNLDKSHSNGAWAVRSGDVAAVPEPGTVLLMAVGLLGLRGLGRSKRRI